MTDARLTVGFLATCNIFNANGGIRVPLTDDIRAQTLVSAITFTQF